MQLIVDSIPEAKRIDQWLVTALPSLTRSKIKALVDAGAITFASGQAISKLSATVTLGMKFAVELPDDTPDAAPTGENIPLDILYEDEAILVINKQADLVVHPACGHATGTLVNALLHHCPTLPQIDESMRPGIVHRLDKDTSGVMIVAKSLPAMEALIATFKDHASLTKEYLAITHGVPRFTQGTVDTLIGRHPKNRQKQAIVKDDGKRAITHYHVEANLGSMARVICQIETGRTHQIRVHLASLGTPIVGDSLYGKPPLDKKLTPVPTRQLLHAYKLIIPHPITHEQMTFIAPPPAAFSPYL